MLHAVLITAPAGTRDLGLKVYLALTKLNLDQSAAAILCVAFIIIFADRVIKAAAVEKAETCVMTQIFERAYGLPCFKNPKDVSLLSGGITNVNLHVADTDLEYVVRLGADIPEHGVMRWNELVLSRAAHVLGIAPKVVYHQLGVLVLEFLRARTFLRSMCVQRKTYHGLSV